jgi:hypothetical protein
MARNFQEYNTSRKDKLTDFEIYLRKVGRVTV